jgi:hypothetical protein
MTFGASVVYWVYKLGCGVDKFNVTAGKQTPECPGLAQ